MSGETNLTSLEASLLRRAHREFEPSQADSRLREAPAAEPESELETARGALGRILVDFGTLQQDRVRIRMERNTIRARFKKLSGKYELLKSELDKDRTEHQRLGAENATIRNALGALTPDDIGNLRAELDLLRRERDRTATELDSLRQDHSALQAERDSVRALLEQLRGELDRLGSAQDQERQEYQRQAGELATIKKALGALSPDEIGNLKAERESFKSERDGLREQVQALRGELSDRGSLAEVLAQHGDELHSARRLADRYLEQIRHVEVALAEARADELQLNREVQAQHDQLEAARARVRPAQRASSRA